MKLVTLLTILRDGALTEQGWEHAMRQKEEKSNYSEAVMTSLKSGSEHAYLRLRPSNRIADCPVMLYWWEPDSGTYGHH